MAVASVIGFLALLILGAYRRVAKARVYDKSGWSKFVRILLLQLVSGLEATLCCCNHFLHNWIVAISAATIIVTLVELAIYARREVGLRSTY